MPSSSCSPTTAGRWAPPASPSATLTRGTGPGASPPLAKSPRPCSAGGSHRRLLEQAHLGGRILNIPVPHTGQTPFKAGLPLAIFTCWALEIFRLALHFTQYPSSAAIGAFPAFAIAFLRSGAGSGGQGRLPRVTPPGR